ncbi:MAG: hypothetical protein L3K13_08810 [Thermoplasmata archaeon]|nr:hypothetical protein [Thermoplasmata archaeon]
MPRDGRRGRPRALAAAFTILLTFGTLLPAFAASQAATEPVTLVLSPGGTLTTNLTVQIANGSSLRYALDGNFTPLLNALPISSSNRSVYAAEIGLLESNPFTGGLFGNRDGTVEPFEVTAFDQLVQEESKLLPSGTLTGGVAFQLTLDGNSPASAAIQSVYVGEALGLDSSTAPVTVSLAVNYVFPLSGGSHSLSLSWGTGPIALTTLINFHVTFLAPAGDSITGSSGFSSTSVTNDLLGFSPGKFSGEFSPADGSGVSIHFAAAFPLGILVIVLGVVGALLAVLLFLAYRSRRRKREGEGSQAPETAPTPSTPAE